MNFAIKDVGGVVHHLNLSTDKRGLAYDSMPRGLSRRPARDQGLADLPDQLDDDTACVAIAEILKRVGNPDDILSRVQRNLDRGENNGESNGKGDRRPRAMDSAASLKARQKVLAREDLLRKFPDMKRIGGV